MLNSTLDNFWGPELRRTLITHESHELFDSKLQSARGPLLEELLSSQIGSTQRCPTKRRELLDNGQRGGLQLHSWMPGMSDGCVIFVQMDDV